LVFSLTEPAEVRFAIYDPEGRVVNESGRERMPAGAHTLGWDGSNAAGQSVAPGVYFFRLDVAGRSHYGKVVRIN